MGLSGISIWQLLIIFAIVVVVFGTKRLKNLGGDLGAAIKGFKKSMQEEESLNEGETPDTKPSSSPSLRSEAGQQPANSDSHKTTPPSSSDR